MGLHPEIKQLADLMGEIEDRLRSNGEISWANKVAKCRRQVEASDAHGAQQFLGFLGGMGSLTDLVLHRDGLPLSALENEAFAAILTKTVTLARRLLKE